jgi:hypothetical protein
MQALQDPPKRISSKASNPDKQPLPKGVVEKVN